ncbi:exodeoxyribonuclease VII large subunit [Nitrosococcus oceani]|uniref:exodeoxyribonuclease VII large subunit n=1 Tax=Nitrosococcus oceani TaxID=1229 RepID=UPI0004E86DF6|nr:exodeoxyribonuclease VII large subunit [Nitrosococcus oceani]KFI23544.1 exodeoxyribonuclease VII large subunit [Nitrosococcus oceani]
MESPSHNLNPTREIYTISRLTREARHILEGSFPLLWIEGEISNLSRPSSGHFYFTLKDKIAQIRCAMFRNRNRLLGFSLEEGMQVLARVQVGLYEARGEFQLIVEYLEEAGDGALRRAFEALKQRLSAEGLFAAAHKHSLPILPQRIGIITSPSGAAIRDILSVLKRRFPAVPVLIYPTPVQGEGAFQRIAAAIAKAEQHRACDLLILARGGGSLEDLWAFNEEALARVIYHCPLPIICGVGHEIDFTIADFTADQRAPTPSAAAEMAVPDSREWYRNFLNLEQRLKLLFQQHLRHRRQLLENLTKRLRHPHIRLQEGIQQVDELEQRLERAWTHLNRKRFHQLGGLSIQLQRLNPAQHLKAYHLRLRELNRRLPTCQQQRLGQQQMRLEMVQRALHAVSPQATLERGYAIVTGPKGIVLRKASQVQPGAKIEARLAEGHIRGEVTEILDKP